MTALKINDVVAITWEDAWSDSGYYTADSIAKEPPYLVKSVGILIQNDKSGMSIATEFLDNRYRKIQHIPKQMLRKVTRLK